MNQLGLTLATAVAVALLCATGVTSRSLDIASESEKVEDDLSALNIPGVLEFEGGSDDDIAALEEGPDTVRDKRTPRVIFRTVSCLFTFLVNPSCLQGITGGGSSGSSFGSSSSSNRRQQGAEPYYMISLPRYNDSDSNNTSATEYPVYPIESTSEYPDDTPSRPTNPIMAMIQWKLNLIPNLIRRFFPGFGGGRGSSGGGLGFGNLGQLFGGGSGGGLSSLLSRFGGGRALGGFGLGGFGGGAGAGQY